VCVDLLTRVLGLSEVCMLCEGLRDLQAEGGRSGSRSGSDSKRHCSATARNGRDGLSAPRRVPWVRQARSEPQLLRLQRGRSYVWSFERTRRSACRSRRIPRASFCFVLLLRASFWGATLVRASVRPVRGFFLQASVTSPCGDHASLSASFPACVPPPSSRASYFCRGACVNREPVNWAPLQGLLPVVQHFPLTEYLSSSNSA